MAISQDNVELTLQLYSSPELVQSKALDMLEEKVLDGNTMPDGNNPTTFLMEFAASISAGIVNEMSTAMSALYPARALTTKDLYRHMSDYDYVNLFSTPASTYIELVMSRAFLIQNAVQYNNTEYKRIVIPQQTTFMVGEYQFGIHYPIIIKIKEARDAETGNINYNKCLITTEWDQSNNNPLQTKESNILENRVYTRNGTALLCIKIPVHQFTVTKYQEDLVYGTGFHKRYQFTNQFYAVRIFHYWEDAATGETNWVEMAQTMADIIYDPQILTAKVNVYTDTNTLDIEIPQLYFTAGMIGTRIRMYVYTTQGVLEVDISEYTPEQFSASFAINDDSVDDTYSSMLKRLPYCQVLPYSSKIEGGSNGLSFNELRDRVVHDSTYQLLITPTDITNYFSDQSYTACRYIDNLTNRIYLVQKELTNTQGNPIDAGDITVSFTSDMLQSVSTDYSTIKNIDSNSYLILPTTVFKYDTDKQIAVPMDNTWVDNFNALSNEAKINLLNNDHYTYTPFHLKIDKINETPVACYYDLLNPKIMNTTFEAENRNLTTQIAIYNSGITHRKDGTDGYQMDITLYKTGDIANVLPFDANLKEHIKVVLKTRDRNEKEVYMFGVYNGELNGRDRFTFYFRTDYKINSNDDIGMPDCFKSMDTGEDVYVYLPLTNNYTIQFFIDKQFITAETPMADVADTVYPPEITGLDIWLTTQSLTIKLGETVPELYTNISVQLESQKYVTYPTTEFATYTTTIYARDPDTGILKYPLEVLHEPGELILVANEDGETTPPSCVLVNGGTKTLYLEQPYTATSHWSNMWRNDSGISIEVVDVLKTAYDDAKSIDQELSVYRDLLNDACDGHMFVYIEDARDDTNTPIPETALKIQRGTEAVNGAIYRRNSKYANYDYKRFTCVVPDSTEVVHLTKEILTDIYNKYDNGLAPKAIADAYQMQLSEVNLLVTKIRYPWIRLIDCSSLLALKSYLTNRKVVFNAESESPIRVRVNKLRNDQIALKHIIYTYGNLYSAQAALDNDMITDTSIVYVSDVGNIDIQDEREYGDLPVLSTQTKGALLQANTSGTTKYFDWMITGPSKNECVNYIGSRNTLSGAAYVISQGGTPMYINFLSYDDGKLDVDMDTVNWALIDKWPWEVTEKWIDIVDATEHPEIYVAVDEHSSAKILHLGGETQLVDGTVLAEITDADGTPVPETSLYADTRRPTLSVRMLQVDYKLTQAPSDPLYSNYRDYILQTLRGHFANIDIARQSMLERTSVYFSPVKSMGLAKYSGTGGSAITSDLSISIGFRVYVEESVYRSLESRNVIKSNILNIVTKHLATGAISTSRIAEDIRATLSDTVQYVENTSLNGDSNLRLLVINEENTACKPHLKQILVIQDDKTIGVEYALDVEFVMLQ